MEDTDQVEHTAGRYWILAASEAGRTKVDDAYASADPRTPSHRTQLTLVHWVKRRLSERWWPLPGVNLRRRPHVMRGEIALVYVASPVQKVIARVVLDDGPREIGPDGGTSLSQIGIGMLDIDMLTPPVSRSQMGGLIPRTGLRTVPPPVYQRAIREAFGRRPWLPYDLPFQPRVYRVVRHVRVEADQWVREEIDDPWPTVDASGRVRFQPREWIRPSPVAFTHTLGRQPPEGVPERIRGPEVSHEHETVLAIGQDGSVADITDAALLEARSAYDAATSGVFSADELHAVERDWLE